MSAADEAWQEWARHWPYESTWPGETPPAHSTASRESFVAGYRRALEDAADEIQNLADAVPRTTTDPNAYARMVAYDYAVERLRARAAAAAPRETKD